MSTEAIQRARDIVGGTVALATALQVKAATVSGWIVGKRPVPLERCPVIERLTANRVTRKDLRPDVDWSALGESPSSQSAGWNGPERRRAGQME